MTARTFIGTDWIGRARGFVSGEGARARTVRSSIWMIVQIGTNNLLRLASNLILTRLLFPEAFGIMAIVQVFMTGLQMLSTTGTNLSIIQNARGDDPDFLNTAWTIQVGRGVVLWVATCIVALPVAALYDEPILAQLLPVAGITALIQGLQPTKVVTANRHLRMGRLTILNAVVQVFLIAAMALLAWWLQSVWALVLGPLMGQTLRQILSRRMLPGIDNRFRWDATAARELFGFGKYIFLSTIFGFVVNHADKAIIGGFIPLAQLGIYSIASLLAGLPFMIAETLTTKVVLPLYRMRPIAASEANRRRIFAVRRAVIGFALLGNVALAYGGLVLIEVLYDPRYLAAGPMLVLLCLVYVPRIVFVGAGSVLLSQGDSRRFMIYVGALAAAQTMFLFLGVWAFGIVGAIVSHALAILVTSPLRIAYARRYEAWDALGEGLFLTLGLGSGLFACWLHLDEILALLPG